MSTDTITIMPTNRLIPHPQNVRSDLGDLRTLMNSIESQGILEPLLVRDITDDDNTYQVVAGHRRLEAAKKVGLEEVPVIVRDLTDEDTIALMLVENLQREDIDPWDEARGYFRLVEFGWTQKKLAEEVGVSAATIRNRLRLLQLPVEWGEQDPYSAEDLAAVVELTDHEMWDDDEIVSAFEGVPAPRQIEEWLNNQVLQQKKQEVIDSLPEDEPLIEKEYPSAGYGSKSLPKNHIFIQHDDLKYDEEGLVIDVDTVRENGHLGWYVDVSGYGENKKVRKLAVITDRGYYTRKSSKADPEERPAGWEKEQEKKAQQRAERERRRELEQIRRERIKMTVGSANKTDMLAVVLNRGINELRWTTERDAAAMLDIAVYMTAEEAEEHPRLKEGEYNQIATAEKITELSQVMKTKFLTAALMLERSSDELAQAMLDEHAPFDEDEL